MRPYRESICKRSVLLFLLLNLTACQTWQAVSTPLSGDAISGSQEIIRLIEEDRPDAVRVTGGSFIWEEVERPAINGDQLVGAGGFSMPTADILRLETQRLHVWRSIGVGYLAVGIVAAIIGIKQCVSDALAGPQQGTC